MPTSYDIIGSIAVLKFRDKKLKEKREIAKILLKEYKNIRTVVEKIDKVRGRLRTIRVRHLAGFKTSETTHKENGCRFMLDIEKCYFSPRLSNERLEIARMVKKNDVVLVMFSGIGVYPIVMSKISMPKKIVAVELGKECSKYALINNKLNKTNVEVIQGNVKRVVLKFKEKFDFIVMPRPQLREMFLQEAFFLSKKGTKIIYNGFCQEKELEGLKQKITDEAKKAGKKIKILQIKKAGEIAPYTYRWRIVFRVV